MGRNYRIDTVALQRSLTGASIYINKDLNWGGARLELEGVLASVFAHYRNPGRQSRDLENGERGRTRT